MKHYQTLAVVQYYATAICGSIATLAPANYQAFWGVWTVACGIATIYCLVKSSPQ